MICLSTVWLIAVLLADMWIVGALVFVVAGLFAAGGRGDY